MENEWVNSLRNLENSQIAELFDGVCSDCQALLKSRLYSLCNNEIVKEPSTSDLSRSFASETSSTQSSPVNNNQEEYSELRKKLQSRESILVKQHEANINYLQSLSPFAPKPEIHYLYNSFELSPSSQDNERIPGKKVYVVRGSKFEREVFDPEEEQKEIDESFYEFERIRRSGIMDEIYNELDTMDISKSFAFETGSTQSSPDNNNQQQHRNHEKTPQNRESANSVEHEANTNHLSSPSPVTAKPQLSALFSNPDLSPSSQSHLHSSTTVANGSSSDEEEWRRSLLVERKKNFMYYETVDGKNINVVQGLELHTGVFNPEEQKKIVESVYDFQRMGQKGQLMARTYSEPKKWMRGKGRVTMQFGCCYNYALDKDGNPPGIIRDEEVDPLPPIFKQMIRRIVRWHVLPPSCIPNSCIVNIYDEGDCIPPHIDHHDFLRPFCTVSFLAECNILFGSDLKVTSPGEFTGPVSIPLPVGSVLVLNGNGADVAKHCVPAVPAKRISVTFRKMDDSKIPYQFSPDTDLLNIKPLVQPSLVKADIAAQNQHQEGTTNGESKRSNTVEPTSSSFVLDTNGAKKSSTVETTGNSFVLDTNDFPPLSAVKSRKRR